MIVARAQGSSYPRKFEARNPKSETFCFAFLGFEFWSLFRVSIFEFRILYSTVGLVAKMARPKSFSSLSWETSACRWPRKPQRKPRPSAFEEIGEKLIAASFNFNFRSPSSRYAKSSWSTGKKLTKTTGCGLRYPGRGESELRIENCECVSHSNCLGVFNICG